MKRRNNFEAMEEFLKGLAQTMRLKILYALKDGEKCVCEICPEVGGEQPNVSRHLAQLKRAGIITSRKNGVNTFYRVRNPQIFNILDEIYEYLRKTREEELKELRS